MKTLTELKNDAAKLADIAGRLAQAAEAYQAEREKISSDRTRSQEWKAEATKKINDELVPTVLQARTEVAGRFAEMQEVEPYFTTPLLVLGREPFLAASYKPLGAADERGQWAANEATVRANTRAELLAMPKAAQKLWAVAAAQARNWGAVYQAALVLGDELPYNLGSLPVPALETADEIYYQAEVAVRDAEISADAVKGIRISTKTIALGLLAQRYEQKKLARQQKWSFTVDERKELGLDTPKGLNEMMHPEPMDLTLPDRQTGAGFKQGAKA